MPYQSTAELPVNIKKQYSDKAQEAFMAAFNSIMKQTNDEARAFAGAHAAARKIDGVKESVVYKEAEWDTAYMNNLPDSSFAYIAPGGEKDSEGKTVPRSLRYFPYKDASGKVDLPHLRNALARAPQSPVGDKAMPKLKAAAKAENVGEFAECSFWMESTFNEVTSDEGVHKARVTVIKPGVSKNNFYYSKNVLSGLPPLMEGAKAYLDHEMKSEIKERGGRSVKDLIGWYSDVNQDVQDGSINATLNFVPGKSDWIVEALKVNPSLMGLSINAKGKASRGKIEDKSVMIAEAFDKVYSTDIVTEAAAGGEVTQMVASVTTTIENDNIEESEEMTDEEKWLVAEMKHNLDIATYLALESKEKLGVIEESERRKVEDTESWLKAERLEKVPADYKEVAGKLDIEGIDQLMEALSKAPAEVKGNPPASPGTEPKPGEEGYERKLL